MDASDVNLAGWVEDPDDPGHWGFEDLLESTLAPSFGDTDLREYTSPRHNQRTTGSCVAQSLVKALELKRIMQYGYDKHVDLSILCLYYLAREQMGPEKVNEDKGTYISFACHCMREFGVPPEKLWGFDPKKVFKRPPLSVRQEGYVHKIQAHYRIKSRGDDRVKAVRKALQSGNPVVFGTRVGSNWMSYRKGETLGLPDDNLGGHATVLVGDTHGLFIGENSWGRGWGDDGFYWMDPEVIASGLSRDFWVITGGWEPFVKG